MPNHEELYSYLENKYGKKTDSLAAPTGGNKVVDTDDALLERMRLSSSLRDMSMGTQMRNIHDTVEDTITSNPTHLYNYLTTDDDNTEQPSQVRGKALAEKIQPAYDSVKGEDKDFVASKYATADKLVNDLYATAEDGTIEIDGYKYPKAVVSNVMRGIVENTMHPQLFATNKDYRSNYFLSNFGKDESAYYADRLGTLDKELNELLQMMRNEASSEAQSMTSAANQFGYSNIATPAVLFGLQESMGANVVRDAIDKINSLKKGTVWAGINEGFDWVSALSMGLNDIASSASLSKILNKITEDEPLSPREELAFKAYTLSKEVDSIGDIVGRNKWNDIGQSLGKISEFALPMAAPVKFATAGVKMTSLGVKEALATTIAVGKKSIPTAIGKGILETAKVGGRLGANVARAEIAGAMLAPFTPITWANFAEKRLQQYSVNNDGEIEFKPSKLWKDIVDVEIEQANEIASEIFGLPLQKVIGNSAKTFGRLLRLDVVADKVGLGADKRFIFGLRKPAAVREFERSLGFAGLFGDGSSEILGEYLSESMKSVITGNGDVSRLNNSEFWGNTLLISALYGGSLSIATLPLSIEEYKRSNIYQASKSRGVALSRIEDRELRNKMLTISSIDDIEMAAKELAQLDWSAMPRKDIAAAMDFVRADYMEKVLLGDAKENMRMNAYSGVALNTAQYVYRGEDGSTPTDDIISIDTEDGRYMVISGVLDNASDSELICRDANGKIVPIHASKIQGIYKHSLQEELGEQYKQQFGVQVELDRQQEIIEKLNAIENPTKNDIASVMSSFGVAEHQQGDEVTLVDGRRGVVDSLEDDGNYIVRVVDNKGEQYLSVPFYDILADDATMAEAQQMNYMQRSVSNLDEYSQKVKETAPEERNGIAIGDIVSAADGRRGRVLSFNEDGTITIDENMSNTSGNLDDAYIANVAESDVTKEDIAPQSVPNAPETPADDAKKVTEEAAAEPAIAEIKPIPTKEDGAIDYDAIDDPAMFAEQFSKDMGGAEAASVQLAKMMEASRKEIEKLTAKGETLTDANEVVSNRKAVEALNNKVKFYSEVIKELNPEPKAGVIENEYSLQLDPKFKKFINTMAEAFGLTVEFVEGIKGNAQISGNKVKIAWEHRDKGIKFLIGHEFTHRMQDLSPEQYVKFKESAKEFLGEEAWNERLARMKQTYIYNKERFDRTLLEDEVVADFVGQLVEQADAFDRYINSVEDKGILATIAKVLRSIRDFIFNAEAEAAKPLTEMLDKLDTLIESSEVAQSETQEMERLGEKETATEENTHFSLPTINGLNDAIKGYNATSDIASFVSAVRAVNDKFGNHPYITNVIMDYEEDGNADEFVEKIKSVIGENTEDYAPYTVGGVKYSLSEETTKIFDAAKAKFGTTYDMREAGYILPDGSMLDFSGRHQVEGDASFLNGDRTVDHREISDIAYDAEDNETGIKTDLGDFLDRGAIRIDGNAGAINLNVAPTKAQKDRLKLLIERNEGYVYIDFGKGWDTEHYAEYEAARASRVLGDIDRYFDEGIKPTGNVRFSLQETNDRFNAELATLTEENKDKVNLSLGMPSDILLAAGVVNKPMKLYGAKLWAKSQKHGYKVSDLRDLPKNVAAPIAIFKGSTDGSHAVLTEIKVGENNVLATLSVGKGGEDIDFNIISSLYGKQSDNVVKWIEDGKLEYVDKEKALNYLHHSAPIAEALSNPRLISTANIIQNFQNPKIEAKYSLITPEMDTAYLDAVERGDMETAQQMVMEAAKLAMPNTKVIDENGNPKVVYHGDRKKARYIFSTDTFFTPKEEYAKRYTNGTGEVYATFLDIKSPFDIRDKKAYDIFTEFRGGRKPVVTTTGAMDWGEYSYEDLQEYVEDVAPNEYDGFILDEGADPDGNGGVVHRGVSFVPFTPNQIKSADSVTYDDAGNVIPLSERFNPEKEDIRYSLSTEEVLSSFQLTQDNQYDYSWALMQTITGGGYFDYAVVGDMEIRIKEHTPNWDNFLDFDTEEVKHPKILNITVGDYNNTDYRRNKVDYEEFVAAHPETTAVNVEIEDGTSIEDAVGQIHTALQNKGVDFEFTPSYEWVKEYSEENNDLSNRKYTRHSLTSAPVFYSNAQYAVQNIKQEKATPEQWLKMIEKNGGLKTGEDKWLGLSDWLKASDKKTLTKDEVLQYIAENDIQIEEVSYDEPEYLGKNEIYESDAFSGLMSSLTDYDEDGNPHINYERYKELQKADRDFRFGFWLGPFADILDIVDKMAAARYLGLLGVDNAINDTRLQYTTQGLTKKKEIALVVPTIEPYNQSDEIHFGDAGEGRAVAWIRFGETEAPKNVPMHQRVDAFDAPFKNVAGYDVYAPEGRGGKFSKDYVIYGKLKDSSEAYIAYIGTKPISKHETLEEARNAMNEYYEANPRMVTRYERVLVIDEIQSKRHQDGREKGYNDKRVSQQELYDAQEAAFEAVMEQERALADKYGEDEWASLASVEEMAEYERLRALDETATNAYENYDKGVPSAPFEKNWAELAMKRMLRYAAENGFDKVAWTTGEQQADRYNIGNVVSRILSYPFEGKTKVIINLQNDSPLKMTVNSEGVVEKSNNGTEGQSLADVVGKELANKIMNGEGESATVYDGGDIEAKEISGDGLRIGGEGMKAFYDQMLPSFVKKYTKKWGAEVGEVTMPDLEENNTMHAVNVTDSMRESVMQGQPKFSLHDVEAQRFNRKVEFIKDMAREYNISQPIIVAETAEEYLSTFEDIGVKDPEKYRETAGAYIVTLDCILLNGERINTAHDSIKILHHEYTHSVTHKLWDEVQSIVIALNESDIIDAGKDILPKYYKNHTPIQVLNEIISTFVENIPRRVMLGIFNGTESVENVIKAFDRDIYSGISTYEVVKAILPIVAHNIEIQKQRYGERKENPLVFGRESIRENNGIEGREGNKRSGGRSDISRGYRPIKAESRIYETGRGGEGSQEEVGTRYALLSAPITEEEQIRIYLRQKHLKNKEDIRKKYRAYRSAARLHYNEERAKRSAALKNMRSYAAKVEYILGDQVEQTIPYEHQALAKIARGEIKMPWKALSKELGLKRGEKRYYTGITKDADTNVTFDGVVHQWWQDLGGYEADIDTQDLRNALIDALSTATSSSRALSVLREIYDKDIQIKDDALDAADLMETEELAAEDARYAEEEERFNANKDTAVEEFVRTSSFYNQIEVVDATVMQIRERIEKTEMALTHRQQMRYYQGVMENIAELKQAVKDVVLSKTIEVLDRNALRSVIDKIDKARSLSEIDGVLAEIEEISLNATIKAQMKNMGRMLQLRLPNGVSVEEWVDTQVKEGRLSRADGDAILRDKWKGRNAKGVSVAKKVDVTTAAIFQKLSELIYPILAIKGNQRVSDDAVSNNNTIIDKLRDDKIAAEHGVAGVTFTEAKEIKLQARILYDKFLQTEMLKSDADECMDTRSEIEQHYYGVAGKEAVREKHLTANRKALNEINRQRKEAIDEFNETLLSLMGSGRDALTMFRREQEAHKSMVVNMALDALGVGNRLVSNPPTAMEKVGAFARSVPNAPYYTFQTTLREIDRLAPNGEGRFYNYLMSAWAESNNNFITQHNSHIEEVADALSRILGVKGANNADIIMNMIELSDDKPLLTVHYGGEEAISKATPESKVLTLSNALYVIAMWRQARYRASMKYHGFTQQMYNAVYDAVVSENEKYITFIDWVNNELLPDTRLIYDKVHREMFGASMANERNYFPARLVDPQKAEDISLNDVGALPSTMTGAIVNRINNKNMVNLNMNYFKVLMSHLQEMDQWSTFAPLIRDLNAIVSDKTFKKSCNTLKPGIKADRSGAGSLFTIFKTVSAIAVNCYRPSHQNDVEDFLIAMTRGWAGSNIAFRFSTALKQLASSPVFAVYATDPKCLSIWAKNSAKTFAHQRQTLEWAKANSPMFRKRWESKFAGMDIFESKVREGNEGVYNAVKSSKVGKGVRTIDDAITKFATEYGMTPNAFIDAMTVANGIRTVYEYEVYLAEKRNGGKPATEEQKRKALVKAEIAFNESQQSSESAFVSQWQSNRTFVTRALATYQNSAYGFHRLRIAAANEYWKQTFNEDYRNRLVDTYGPEQAKKMMEDARKKAMAQLLQGTVGDMIFVLMGAAGTVPLFTYLGGDDDEGEAWDLLKTAMVNMALNVTTGGYALGSLLNSGLFGYNMSLDTAWENLVTQWNVLWDYDVLSWPFAYQALNIVAVNRYGVDFDTLANIATGIEGLVENESSVEAVMKVLNIPQSQINLVAGKRREGESIQEYVARRLRIESIGAIPYIDENGKVIANPGYWQNPFTPRKSYVAKYRGEYEDDNRRATLKKIGGNDEYRDFVKTEEEYKDVVKALGWTADTKPNNDAYINGVYSVPPIDGLSKEDYNALWKLAYEAAHAAKDEEKFVGTEDRYYDKLKMMTEKRQKLIDRYNEL